MTMRWIIDEDFDNDILRGLLRRLPRMDIVRAQDVGLSGAKDVQVLEWAAADKRVLLTHDVSTMTSFATQRINAGLAMPGIFIVSQRVAISVAIDEILLLEQCSIEGEWEAQIQYLPL